MHLHVAEHPLALVDDLTGTLAVPLDDPCVAEWIAVPSEGMRRWLRLHLARRLGATPGAHDGIAANIRSAFPESLRTEILASARGAGVPDPWEVERLTWAILDVFGDDPAQGRLLAHVRARRSRAASSAGGESRFSTGRAAVSQRATAGSVQLVLPFDESADVGQLPPGVGDAPAIGHVALSGYGTARHLAELFDRYHVYRAAMIRSWAQGRDTDGFGNPLPPHHRWQPELWREVRRRLGVASAPERLPIVLGQVSSGALALDLPPRLSLFGLTVLPGGPAFLDVARAVATVRDVHLFVLTPSLAADAYRGAVPPSRPVLPAARSADVTSAVSHPLLRSWGALSRETGALLATASPDSVNEEPSQPTAEASGHERTLLSALQEDIRKDLPPRSTLIPRDSDQSVQFHACYGSTRQVEVLRDVVVHLLRADPSLREDDILVMSPALSRFAPIVEAVLGPSAEARSTPVPEDDVPPHLRYRIVDRSLRSTTALLTATAALMDLVDGRFDATTVLDFLALGPVRTRYGFTEEELALVNGWISENGTRWGLDAAHRHSLDFDADISSNTWQAGMDRLLLGVATAGGEFDLALGNVLPMAVVGDETDLVGRLAEVLWHLGSFARKTSTAQPVTRWLQLLTDSIEALFAVAANEEWQHEALTRVLAGIEETLPPQASSSRGAALSYSDFRSLLADRMAAASGRADFFRGGMTVTSLRPLRWIPFRVVCLLGFDHGAFSTPASSNDDLTAAAPMIGDRDLPGESRQTVLEAVLAASDCVVVLRDGTDVRTNQEIAPTVVVSELYDAVVATAHPDVRVSLRQRLELSHPRQAYDERSFALGGVRQHETWGTDPRALTAARQRRHRQPTRRPFLPAPLPSAPRRVIELSELHRFLEHPVHMFVNEHLGVRLPRPHEPRASQIPLAMDGLARWSAGERLLRAQRSGVDPAVWDRAERCRGTVPPGVLGHAALAHIQAQVAPLIAAADAHGVSRQAPTPKMIDVELPGDIRLVGTVLVSQGDGWSGPVRLEFSRAKPKHEVAAWLDLMALVAVAPDHPWRALSIRRRATALAGSPQAAVCNFVPSDQPRNRRQAALDALTVAVDCFRRGHCEPLPLFPTFSHAVHEARGKVRTSDWIDFAGQGDGNDPATRLAFGASEVDDLLALEARPDDPVGPGGRVERFAHYLWGAVRCSVVNEGHASTARRR